MYNKHACVAMCKCSPTVHLPGGKQNEGDPGRRYWYNPHSWKREGCDVYMRVNVRVREIMHSTRTR